MATEITEASAQNIAEALRSLVQSSEGGRGGGGPPAIDPTTLTTEAVNALASQLRRESAAARELVETRLEGMDTATKLVADQVAALPVNLRAQFDRDLAAVRADIHALREILETRIGGIDTATRLLAENVRAVPSDIDKATRALLEILRGEIRLTADTAAEKFTAIEGTFASNALALTAALAAQKEAAAESVKSSTLAIDRANAATKETIAANASQTEAALTAQAANIGDLKERVVRLETGGVVARETNNDTRAEQTLSQTDRIAAQAAAKAQISLVIGALGALVAIVAVLYSAIHG